MKFAYLVMTELRSIDKTIKGLNDYIINYFDADVYICVQQTFNNDNEKIQLFDKNVVYHEIYEKPDPVVYFGNNTNLDIKYDNVTNMDKNYNWNKESNLQIYINYYKMSKIIENVIEKYDFFITMRTDVNFVFPFPKKSLFEKIPKKIYFIDAEYCKNWGGIGFSAFIHKTYILQYLQCYYNAITNNILIQTPTFVELNKKTNTLNQETFQKYCLRLSSVDDSDIKYIKHINFYYTATLLDDYTTWAIPKIHKQYNVICKYETQCSEAYNNLKLWMNKCIWKYKNDSIFLELTKKVVNYRKSIQILIQNKLKNNNNNKR
jgi:hypothetical protein